MTMGKNTSEDTVSMKNVFRMSIVEIEAVLGRKKPITDITRLAANTLSNYSRIKSTEIHDKAIELMIARKDIKMLPELKD
jgi:hypothetical protein